MRGEHCVAGASILSGIAVILLIFANIGQISSGGLTNSIYFAEVNIEAYGNALKNVTKSAPGGLYDASNDKLGSGKGIRQYYRYGLYNACGYQKDGSGTCNSTIFGYPMDPFSQILADTPSKFSGNWKDFFGQMKPKPTFSDTSYNHGLSRAGGLMIFVGSVFALFAFIFGWIKARIFFFIAAICSGLSALLLMIGAAMYTALIAKDAFVNTIKVQNGASLGVNTSAGAALYLTWVSFALITLSVAPYVISCCTFRRD